MGPIPCREAVKENTGKIRCRWEVSPPNAWGLYDMHGNVLEWCQDWYGEYPTGPVTDPTGPLSGARRVMRGGSWDDIARRCRSAGRSYSNPDDRSKCLGLRLAGYDDILGC